MLSSPIDIASNRRPGGPGTRQRGLALGYAPKRHAFVRMIAPFYVPLCGLAMYLCRRQADADDLLQDTLEKAYFAFDKLQVVDRPGVWLKTIMRNRFLDGCRHRAHQRIANESELYQLPAPSAEQPERWRTIDSSQLEAALANLEDDLRRVFLLRWREERSYCEIADELQIPVSTVGTRLLRARRNIRRLLSAK